MHGYLLRGCFLKRLAGMHLQAHAQVQIRVPIWAVQLLEE